MKKILKGLGIGIAIAVLAGGGLYTLTHEDMSHATWAEIEAYRAEHPNVTVTYSLPIDDTLTLQQDSTAVLLSNPQQIGALAELADYFQALQTIDLGDMPITGKQHNTLSVAFPNARLDYQTVTILGKDYPASTTALDLSGLTDDTAADTAYALRALPGLETVDLNGGADISPVPTTAAAALAEAAPEVQYTYTFTLFGQTLNTDMERVEYFQVEIGDEGLKDIRSILPMMRKLTYLKLDWCGTTDEAMAQLRDDFADRMKVVWRIFLGTSHNKYNLLTDTYKIWVQYYIYNEDVDVLKYCTEARYIDMGHSKFSSIDFVKYMPHLDTLILSDTAVSSLEALRSCKDLTYLEIFMTEVADLSPLAELEKLEYLHIGQTPIKDLTPLLELPNLKKFHSTANEMPQDQIDAFRAAQPDCESVFTTMPLNDYGWRYGPAYPGAPYTITPRYALLREQIGYETKDYSVYPHGYVTEEITYESTGITPPPEKTADS